jgi:SPP1 family predicted phage head-tail adaptor
MNKNEHIGQMRERVTLQGVTETQSSTGYPTETWSDIATRWAGVEFKEAYSKEEEMAGQNTAITNAVFRLRYDSTITQKNRVRYEGNDYDIQSIVPAPDKAYMQLHCILRNDL